MEYTISIEFKIDNNLSGNFDNFIESFRLKLFDEGRKWIAEQFEKRDDELTAKRDKSRYRDKGKRATTIKTVIGDIQYSRRVYLDNYAEDDSNKFVYLLDEDLGLKKIGDFTPGLSSKIIQLIPECSYRESARQMSDYTGSSISAMALWNVVQKVGERGINYIDRQTELHQNGQGTGKLESKLLYEENDGIFLSMQGKDRAKNPYGKEMKVGVGYSGVQYIPYGKGKIRRKLTDKVSYARIESAADFHRHKAGLISSVYNYDEIDQIIVNGDGAGWIFPSGEDCIKVLDVFHRNKKVKECVKNKDIAKVIYKLLYKGKYDEMFECIEAYTNSLEDKNEIDGLKTLYKYYSENRKYLSKYSKRGIEILPTRKPGEIHHARLGSMESNVFTLIGNRMKGRRACWSIKGANNLATIISLTRTTGVEILFDELPSKPVEIECEPMDLGTTLSASKIQKTVGEGYEYYMQGSLANQSKWLKDIAYSVKA